MCVVYSRRLIFLWHPRHIISLITTTACPSFLLHHECIGQHKCRGVLNNSSGPSVWQLWKLDSNTLECDARGHNHRPEHYKYLCSQPSNWRSFRRRRVQYPTSVCISYKWYERWITFRVFGVTADMFIAGQYGFLNRLLYYCLILLAVLAASNSWLCWVCTSSFQTFLLSITVESWVVGSTSVQSSICFLSLMVQSLP